MLLFLAEHGTVQTKMYMYKSETKPWDRKHRLSVNIGRLSTCPSTIYRKLPRQHIEEREKKQRLMRLRSGRSY